MNYQQLSLIESAETPTTPLLTERPPRSVNDLASGFTHKIYEVPSRGHRYYRYVVNSGHEVIQSLSIPGGNTTNKIAQKRAKLVQEYLDRGVCPSDIINLIGSWQLRDKR
ncbi:hypothetical protein C7B65_06485 [Phormidesmis priestleyi ULC007]|uniref:Uncharacterized protein n=1 Tax=Phormidesmis priestleyi ULC007 TaxID=1920490 RepID=A0A2T1DJ79_9CYAN|nr:hypothetical protein [Phormidesmis priestleyi]PSB20548.1 hypothetical protein C7B65_06485 [Phormidesmis priestleyi ULC007]PZO54218.1 MAG: hypothetical protein DCF14_02130 [Phormidesmis priestleyi]